MNNPIVFYDLSLSGGNASASNDQVSWVIRNKDGATIIDDTGMETSFLYGSGYFDDAPAAATCVLVVPADLVTFFEIDFPRKNRADFLKALPFAVEDRILSAPDTVHVIAGTPAGDKLPVAILDRAWVERMTAAAQQAGFRVVALYSEVFLLPDRSHTEHGWALMSTPQGWVVRTGPATGWMLPAEMNTPEGWAAFMGDPHAPRSLHTFGDTDVHLPDFSGNIYRHSDDQITSALESLASGQAGAWNLLPGAGVSTPLQSGALKRFKAAAIMVGFALTTQVALGATQWLMLKHERQQLQSSMEASFKKAFPQVRTIVDPELQMQRNLSDLLAANGMPGETDLLSRLSIYSKLIQSGGGEMTEVHYHNGTLSLRFRSPAPIPAPAAVKEQSESGSTLWSIPS